MCIGLPDVFCWRLLECWFQCRRLIRDACSDKLFPGDFYLSCFMATVIWCILNLALIDIYFHYVLLLTGTDLDFWKTIGWSLCHRGCSQGGWTGAIFWVRILLCLTHFWVRGVELHCGAHLAIFQIVQNECPPLQWVFPTFYSNRSLSHCKIQLVSSVGEALLFHRNNKVSITHSHSLGRRV